MYLHLVIGLLAALPSVFSARASKSSKAKYSNFYSAIISFDQKVVLFEEGRRVSNPFLPTIGGDLPYLKEEINARLVLDLLKLYIKKANSIGENYAQRKAFIIEANMELAKLPILTGERKSVVFKDLVASRQRLNSWCTIQNRYLESFKNGYIFAFEFANSVQKDTNRCLSYDGVYSLNSLFTLKKPVPHVSDIDPAKIPGDFSYEHLFEVFLKRPDMWHLFSRTCRYFYLRLNRDAIIDSPILVEFWLQTDYHRQNTRAVIRWTGDNHSLKAYCKELTIIIAGFPSLFPLFLEQAAKNLDYRLFFQVTNSLLFDAELDRDNRENWFWDMVELYNNVWKKDSVRFAKHIDTWDNVRELFEEEASVELNTGENDEDIY